MNERNEYLKKLYLKDRQYFRDMESDLKNCVKVWDIPLTSSCIKMTDSNSMTYELKAYGSVQVNEELLTEEEKFELAKQEHLRFSSFDENGNFVSTDLNNIDAINTNNLFTKSSHTKFKFNPFDK